MCPSTTEASAACLCKEVQIQARSVDNWELEPSARPQKPRVTTEAAHQVACLYNSFISSIIENTGNWTLENGYRMMIASIGISFDGGMRNTLGRLPEKRVRQLLLRFASDNSLLMEAWHEDSSPEKRSYTLIDGFVMTFGSEPDVAFRKDGRLEATIEIKGGIDPAGALETARRRQQVGKCLWLKIPAARISWLQGPLRRKCAIGWTKTDVLKAISGLWNSFRAQRCKMNSLMTYLTTPCD